MRRRQLGSAWYDSSLYPIIACVLGGVQANFIAELPENSLQGVVERQHPVPSPPPAANVEIPIALASLNGVCCSLRG